MFAGLHSLEYDETGGRWIRVTLALPLQTQKVLMLTHAVAATKPALLRSVPQVGECFVLERRRADTGQMEHVVQVSGCSFEEAIRDLQQIVTELEGGSITLDVSLKRFEEGIGLLRQCYQFLDRTEQRIGHSRCTVNMTNSCF